MSVQENEITPSASIVFLDSCGESDVEEVTVECEKTKIRRSRRTRNVNSKCANTNLKSANANCKTSKTTANSKKSRTASKKKGNPPKPTQKTASINSCDDIWVLSDSENSDTSLTASKKTENNALSKNSKKSRVSDSDTDSDNSSQNIGKCTDGSRELPTRRPCLKRGLPLSDIDDVDLEDQNTEVAKPFFASTVEAYVEALESEEMFLAFKTKCLEEEREKEEEKKNCISARRREEESSDGYNAPSSTSSDEVPETKKAPQAKKTSKTKGAPETDELETTRVPEATLSKTAQRRLKRTLKRIENERLLNKQLYSEAAAAVNFHSSSDEDIECLGENKNREINLKVRHQQEIIRIQMKKGDNFSKVFQELARKLSAKLSSILLCWNEQIVNVEDTPLKLNVASAAILDCYIWNSEKKNDLDKQNSINVKLQSNDSKTKTCFPIHKLEPFSTLMEKYAEHRGIALSRMVFEFDGEKISPSATAVDLDMENDSCVDVRIV